MSRGGRMRRVNELLREVIASEVVLLKDPGIGFVTVTGVESAPDLRAARVFYSVLGDDEQKKATAAALVRASPRIRGALADQTSMKFVPHLDFVFDEAIERGIRMEQLLRNLEGDDDDDRLSPA